MSSSSEVIERREQALDRLIREYYAEVEQGGRPAMEQWLARHPEYEKELRSFFLDVHHLKGMAEHEIAARPSVTQDATNDETNPRADEEFQPPRSIRDYEVLRKLGEGGMGTVYLAVHTHLEKRVAIKFIKGDRGNQSAAIQRFRREIRAVGRFDHEHIVRALDAGQINGLYYLVMEFIDGCDLADLLHHGPPLTVSDACELTRQAAIALGHAHQFGLVHRDVKPSNLMLTPSGKVKLLDLGLAQLQSSNRESTRLTVNGQAVGTLKYMAPEQFEDCRSVTASCDLYALGVTLFELLYGELSTSQFVTGVDYASMLEIRGDVPLELLELIRSMTAPDPGDRLQSADEVAERLTGWSDQPDLIGLFQANRRLVGSMQSLSSTIASPPIVTGLHSGAQTVVPPPPVKRSWRTAMLFGLACVALVGNLAWLSGWFHSTEKSTPVIAERGASQAIEGQESPVPSPEPSSIALDWPVDLPWIPDQPGAKAEFHASLAMIHGEQMYKVELQCLDEATVQGIAGQSLRWIQTRILDLQSECSESAWLLIDTEQYENQETLSIHGGFLEASLPEGAELSLTGSTKVVRRWSDTIDPMQQLAEQAGFEWPLTRISTMTLLSVLCDLPHPAVSPQFRELRSRLNTHTDLRIDRTSFVTKHGEVPAVRATATPKLSGSPTEIGYVVERAEDYQSVPFSLLSVEIKSEPIYVMFKRSKDSLENPDHTIDLERLESAAAVLDSFLDEEPHDFSRAILPEAEGAWAKYGGFIKRDRDGRELTFEVEVRAGAREQDQDGRSYRWIEMLVRSGATGRLRSDQGEGVALLIDEDAYLSRGEFQISRGWYLRDGEVFPLETADLGISEGLFRWLHPLALIDRFSVQEALAVLFDAPIPNHLPHAAPLTGLRQLISGRLVQAGAQRNSKRLLLKTPSGKQAFGYVWTVDAPKEAGLDYTIQWSQEFSFGFGNVYFNYPNLFTISTELKDYQPDHASLFDPDDELSRRAEATQQKLSDLGIRTWADGTENPIVGRYRSASKLSVRIETPLTAFKGQIKSLSFTKLTIADLESICQGNSPRTWRSKPDANNRIYETEAAFLGFAGEYANETIRKEMSGNESKFLKVLLLQGLQVYLDHPKNEGKSPEDWAPIEVHWHDLSAEDQQYIRDHWSPPR